jgi:hypothetical protein
MKQPIEVSTIWTNPETGFDLLLTGKVYPGERATRTDDEYPDYVELTRVIIAPGEHDIVMEIGLYSPTQIAEREAAIYEAYQNQNQND